MLLTENSGWNRSLWFTRQGRFKRDAFDLRLDLGDGQDWTDWRQICRNYPQGPKRHPVLQTPTVEVTGELSQIVDSVRAN